MRVFDQGPTKIEWHFDRCVRLLGREVKRIGEVARNRPPDEEELRRLLDITKVMASVAHDHREAAKILKGEESDKLDFSDPTVIAELLNVPGFKEAVLTHLREPSIFTSPEPAKNGTTGSKFREDESEKLRDLDEPGCGRTDP